MSDRADAARERLAYLAGVTVKAHKAMVAAEAAYRQGWSQLLAEARQAKAAGLTPEEVRDLLPRISEEES